MTKTPDDKLEVIAEQIQELQEWRKTIDAHVEVSQRMVEVGEDIISAFRAMGWLATAIKWVASIAVAIGAGSAAIRGLDVKGFIDAKP